MLELRLYCSRFSSFFLPIFFALFLSIPAFADVIETRCLPDSPCLSFPDSLVQADRALRESLVLEKGSDIQRSIVWFTESAPGYLLLFLFYGALCIWRWGPQNCLSTLKKIRPAYLALAAVLVLAGLGLSNEISDQLKHFFGRIKPHVDFYNPNSPYNPALSFPSNHAFNTSFLMTLLWLFSRSTNDSGTSKKTLFHMILLSIAFAMALSRVLVGQHYPLDVLTGAILGALWGTAYTKVSSSLWRRV